MPLGSLEELEQLRTALWAGRDPRRARVAVCCSGCIPSHAHNLASTFAEEIRRRGLEAEVEVVRTGCTGPCRRGPVVMVFPFRTCYLDVQPAHVPAILSQTLARKEAGEQGHGKAHVTRGFGGISPGHPGPAGPR
ncbi:MAG: (2Fe-2S) ferredoxin domain-containing protein [Bacillota bacterium]|nr:(2Fe-2S) ferredoxin domain-containing protein [Bacillota bacterium]